MNTLIYLTILAFIVLPVLRIDFFQKKNLPGIMLSFLIAIPAWYLGRLIPIAGAPIFGILIGILLALIIPLEPFSLGTRVTAKKLLQAAIILFGFEMNLRNVLAVGAQSLLLMIFTLTASFVAAYYAGKALRIDAKVGTLIGVGTAICGGSAIAATAPVIKADIDEIAKSISTIFLFNVMAVFIFPAIGHLIGMTDLGFGMWAGTAINDTSSVVAASYSFSHEAGTLATIVKLTRTLAIVPITFFLAIYTARKNQSTAQTFQFRKVFPWFILGFLATCVINTSGFVPLEMSRFLGQSGKFFIVVAMASIGLNTNLKELILKGQKSLLLGAICWAAVSITSLIFQNIFGLM